jgi:aryl-alcohol dehydrogenase-like predicted oxidoreductase
MLVHPAFGDRAMAPRPLAYRGNRPSKETGMRTTQLGTGGPVVSAIGLGCMGMSGVYGPAAEDESIATIRAALDAGVTLIDTGDFYGVGHNEMLLREALRGRPREDAVLSVKFGALRAPGGGWGGVDTRPAAVRNFLAYTLQRLGTDYVDIYRPARLDPAVPIEDTVGAIADLVQAGYVRHIGLSEVGVETIRRAHAVHRIVDVQLEYSLMSRGIEAAILPACRALGIGVTAYGVLSRGLLGGRAPEGGGADIRAARMPRFQGENLTRNLGLVAALRAVAAARGASPAQLAIAWVASRGVDIVPLVGTSSRARLDEAIAAASMRLDAAALAEIEAAVPHGDVAGARYDAGQMAHLDSER